MYMPVAKSFTISGKMPAAAHGHKMNVEIRKPGRTFWTTIGIVTIGSTGRWSMTYTPKLGGKFYLRARYTPSSPDRLSRTATLTVKKGPGVKYQILLASTTSTQDSGLYEALKPLFQAQCPEYSLKATFVGSGAAIALGGTGDADVLLTHSPAAELDFMKGIVAGAASAHKGLTRYKVMYNHFLLAGPKSNPAGILPGDSAQTAFHKIAMTGSTFISRNDNSGTNAKEKEIWAALGNPQLGQSWYKATGTMGMAQALAAANDGSTGGYTLADNATWLMSSRLKTVGNMAVASEGDAAYFNQYSVIEVRGARNAEGAQDFRRWIMSASVQKVIAEYGIDWYGVPLFTPDAGSY
jgi:tungstate transport system substrate-binding protein